MLPQCGTLRLAKVQRCILNQQDVVYLTHLVAPGTYNDNPLLSIHPYDGEFDDSNVKEYAANTIAENLLTQVDDEGFTTTHLEAIVGHCQLPDAVFASDSSAITKRGAKRLRKTIRVWDLQVKWTDGSVQWFLLSDMKEAYPVQVAEYAKSQSIHIQPAFAWWVPYKLCKQSAIVSQVQAQTRKTTHEYGIKIPQRIEPAYEIDSANKNNLWVMLICKEMTNVGVAFKILDPVLGQSVPSG